MTAAAILEGPVTAGVSIRPLLEIDGVSHVYRSALGTETTALDGVSLSVARGEFVCLLGPSGCGKTTLLNMIAGFVTPSSGRITVDGETVRGPSPSRGVVFQDYSLFPWLTAGQNVAFGPRMAGQGPAARRQTARELLALVGLPDAADRYPAELSGGMKQRVAIARALATDPAVLLMDEPFAALDAMTRAALQRQLLAIHEARSKTVLFVTHNIAEAITLGDRVVVLSPHPGRVAADVTVDLPRPRRRTAPGFNALYAHLADAIGAETTE
ncbi:ABC transporter ATP-binding protein [Methylopila jiangsuensis]|uniref:ABC transporter ATP-binding protein n=1 Tax=Methylopila jiangsuensis TaxID=586230 RepID=A0A9W6N4Z4_9HYPH|nr:ABC transporter ATP-binding protein [Methylopila jiangsuensis]MDR6284900.1 NitT/TauT family transport system ATP-binding protein [Methylopila jiangsuensis]GLK77712.1 ABC transporter ATP-binding protein [Methylopila jiangsuensis]